MLGFFEAESAKKTTKDKDDQQQQDNADELEPQTKGKIRKKTKPKGSVTDRRGRLDVTRAISTIPYDGKVTFSSKSGKKGRTSIYGTEFHGTRYQFGLGITPESCKKKSRILPLLDALFSIHRVGGNHGRFLFDFAPESIILRWTHDFAPRFLYCFEEDEMGNISIPELLRQINSGDLNPQEFWIGGKIADTLQGSQYEEVNKFSGIKETVDNLKQKIFKDLQLSVLDERNKEVDETDKGDS